LFLLLFERGLQTAFSECSSEALTEEHTMSDPYPWIVAGTLLTAVLVFLKGIELLLKSK